MSQVRETQTNRFRRDAWLEINLENLEYNLKKIYSKYSKPVMPILKADAYGHGAVVLSKILDAYEYVYAYGVANIDEALALRQSSHKKIIVLGISPNWSLEQALENDIDLTIADLDFATKLNDIAKSINKRAKVHIKIDTGMNRIGFKLSRKDFLALINSLEQLPNIKIETIFTHFADSADLEYSKEQYKTFSDLVKDLPYPKHPASSPCMALLPEMDFDILRLGIELYGLENPELKPLLSLYSRISFVKEIQAGESVSYKRTWITNKDTKIATLPLGYADGVPRVLSNKIQVYAKDKFFEQVGLITMDQIMIDIGLDSDLKVGDIVELLGAQIPVSDWASKAGTISYEIITNLNLRLPKSYTR